MIDVVGEIIGEIVGLIVGDGDEVELIVDDLFLI